MRRACAPQEIQWLPPALQGLLADLMGPVALLDAMVPSCLLTAFLSDLARQDHETLNVTNLSAPQLRALSRDIIELPRLAGLRLGSLETVEGCAVGGPGAALCTVLACTPAVTQLALRIHVAHSAGPGLGLPLPASLRILDLRGCVLEQYMAWPRARREMLQGLANVLESLSGLLDLVAVLMPQDVFCGALSTAELLCVTPPSWIGKVAVRWFPIPVALL